jgi:DNA-binding CsgD family transcriptional regulator
MNLVEREPFLEALEEHLAAGGRLVLVGGEAGVGKTALVRAFADRLAGRSRVLWGACDALFTPRPLGPFADVAAETRGPLADVLGGGRAHEVLTALLDELRADPTVLVLEDVHWADEATLDLLRLLARRVESSQALVLATFRDDELAAYQPVRLVLGGLASAPGVFRLSLPPLSLDGVRELARRHAVDAEELYRRTAGNPFFVTEVLGAGGDGVPSTIRDAVLARAARLGEDARRLLDAVAVVPLRCELWLLERTARDELHGLGECLSTGMLREDGDGVSFRHELARLAVERSVPPDRRVALHRVVLNELRERGSDLARLAHHAEAAQDSAAVLELAVAAAEEAARRGAHRESAAQYARALRFADELPATERAALLERRTDECVLTEQLEDAAAGCAAALELYRLLGDRAKEAEMLIQASTIAYLNARSDESDARATDAVALLEPLGPSRALALALAHRARAFQLALDVPAAVEWGRRALALAKEVGEEDVALHATATVAAAEELSAAGTEGSEAVLSAALEKGYDHRAARAYTHLVFLSVRRRDWAVAERWLAEGIRFARERDLDGTLAYLLSWSATAAMDQGRWDDAARDLAEALTVDQRPLNRIWVHSSLGLLRARRGDPEVWPALDEAWAAGVSSTKSAHRLVGLRSFRAEAALLDGDAERALEEAGTVPIAELADRWAAGENAVWRARAGGEVGETGPLPEPFALELAGDHAGAAEAWRRLEAPYDAAWALAGSDGEADLRGSLEEFQRLGARPAAAWVARRLRERGARGLARGPRLSTRENPAGLTVREQEVLDLLADGLRNAEIAERLVVSEKTVGHHVSSILAKLGVRSRYDAARIAREDREAAAPR